MSSNWAGYVAGATRFSSVSGSWTEPTVSCTPGPESYSAAWVGLGGARRGATGLEQIGTDADCARSGQAVYSSWYELLPAEAVDVPLAVHPGDHMVASVTVRRRDATLRLNDLSTGARFSVTRRVPSLDVSSAEWIVEAPSLCLGAGACSTETLTNFSVLAFSAATATAHGHTGPIADPAWRSTALELHQRAPTAAHPSAAATNARGQGLIVAAPTPVGVAGAFNVSWAQQAVQGERAALPTLPGASG